MLAQYKAISPELLDRILNMAEDEAKHRRGLEVAESKAAIRDMELAREERKRGQHYAAIVSGLALGCGAVVAIFGQPAAGAVISGLTLLGIVTVFITGKSVYWRKSKDDERLEQDPPTDTTQPPT